MDGKDLGMSLRTGRVRVNVQLAEIAAERLVAFHVKRLIAYALSSRYTPLISAIAGVDLVVSAFA
jgi:hypothetical protein